MAKEAYLEFENAPLLFDVVTSETLEHTAEVTEHPVEDGIDVSDHVRSKPNEISLEIFVSNTPIVDVNGLYSGQVAGLELNVPTKEKSIVPTPGGLMNAALDALSSLLDKPKPWKAVTLQFGEKFDNVTFILSTLLDWKERGVIGKVITPHRTYPTVVITGVKMSRDGTTGAGAPISIALREIRIVEAKLIAAPIPTEERGKMTKPKGRQPTSFVRDPGPKKSLLSKFRNG